MYHERLSKRIRYSGLSLATLFSFLGSFSLVTYGLQAKKGPTTQAELYELSNTEKHIINTIDPKKQQEELVNFLKKLRRQKSVEVLQRLYPYLHPYLISTINPNNVKTVTGKYVSDPDSLSPDMKELIPLVYAFLKPNNNEDIKKRGFMSLAVAYNLGTANVKAKDLTKEIVDKEAREMQELSEKMYTTQLFGEQTIVVNVEEQFTGHPELGNAFFSKELEKRIARTGTNLLTLRSSYTNSHETLKRNISEAIEKIKPGGTIVLSLHGGYSKEENKSFTSLIPNNSSTLPANIDRKKFQLSTDELISYFKKRYLDDKYVKRDKEITLKIIYPICELRVVTDFLEKWQKEFGLAHIPPPLIIASSAHGQSTWYESDKKFNSDFFNRLIFGENDPDSNPTIGSFIDNYNKTNPNELNGKPSLFLPEGNLPFDLFFPRQVVEDTNTPTKRA